MNYLSPQELLFIHYRLTEEMNGIQGIQNLSILKKLAKYVHNNEIFPDKFSKASALLFGIAKKKPFRDLNKQSAALITKIFLSLNKATLHLESQALSEFLKDKLEKATIEEIKKAIVDNSTNLEKQ
uniref:Fic family protein n=1 Tax=candidate division CPR3 bacterium TaxID=2268181 RepID=A0A7C4M0W9_UNCC3